MTNEKPHVLLASSQSSVANLVARMCTSIGIPSVEIASTADQALEAVEQIFFDVVLIDENVCTSNIKGLLSKFRAAKVSRKTRFILMTTSMTKGGVLEAANAGINGILLKPFSGSDLKARLHARAKPILERASPNSQSNDRATVVI